MLFLVFIILTNKGKWIVCFLLCDLFITHLFVEYIKLQKIFSERRIKDLTSISRKCILFQRSLPPLPHIYIGCCCSIVSVLCSVDHCLFFLLWSVYCLSFDLRLLITLSVSPNFTYQASAIPNIVLLVMYKPPPFRQLVHGFNNTVT